MLTSEIYAPGKIRLVEAPEPELRAPGQIIFQPEIACLCGSDLPYFNDSGEQPIEPGHSLHEMIGSVTATSGTRWRAGDRILAMPVRQRGLSERFTLDENRAAPIPAGLTDDQALLAQPLGTVIFALKKVPSMLDQDVAVVGQGPMGQLMNAALRTMGARHIIGIDLLESRLRVSPRMGATETVCNAGRDPVAAVKTILGGSLPDLVVECVGHRDQQFNLCIDLCRHEGRMLFFGVPPPLVDGLRWRDLFDKNVTVHTSIGPDFRRDFPLAMRWIGEGRVDVAPLITHAFPLARLQEAFELFRDRRDGAIKVLLHFPSRAS